MPARKRGTRKEVAERAGVSVAVVSYVVNNSPRPVTPETRAKVEQAIDWRVSRILEDLFF